MGQGPSGRATVSGIAARYCFQNDAAGAGPIRFSFQLVQRIAQQRHAFSEKSLLGSKPKGPPRPSSQKAAAIGFAGALLPTDSTYVLVRGAIAIMAILGADSVAVLCNFARDPIFVWQCGDQVANELGFPDASGVSSDDNNLPPHACLFRALPLCSPCPLW